MDSNTKSCSLCRAQSVTWNPHKLMGALLQCSTIHFKEDVCTFFNNINQFDTLLNLERGANQVETVKRVRILKLPRNAFGRFNLISIPEQHSWDGFLF